MLYPLSYRRKARVVYRGEGGAATAGWNFRVKRVLCGRPVAWGEGTSYDAAVRIRVGLTGRVACNSIPAVLRAVGGW